MADPTDLQVLCVEVLSAAEEALDTIPGFAPGLEGAPERTFITDGEPVLACPQLTVNAARTVEALTNPLGLAMGDRHRFDFRRNQVGIQVWVTRCRPQSVPQDADEMTDHSAQHNADAWALWNHLWNLARDGELVTLCEQIWFDSMEPIRPSGRLSGWRLNLRLNLYGYEETLTS